MANDCKIRPHLEGFLYQANMSLCNRFLHVSIEVWYTFFMSRFQYYSTCRNVHQYISTFNKRYAKHYFALLRHYFATIWTYLWKNTCKRPQRHFPFHIVCFFIKCTKIIINSATKLKWFMVDWKSVVLQLP